MEVRPGYKQTEVGIIPEDWEAKKMEDVISRCFSGATPRRNRPEFYRGDIRWITSGELNYNLITDSVEKITREAVSETNLALVPAGTFLMAITGLEAEGTRGACGIVGVPATTNQSCMAVFPKRDLLTKYLFHYYVFRGKQLALQYCQGTKQQSYTAKLVKQLPIALPSAISEQRAISSALSDVDELIDSLDRLIAKKRDLKQAAMQQLLTGQTRLPGFSGEWEVKRLGDLAQMGSGGTPLSSVTSYYDGNIPWVSIADMTKCGKFINSTDRNISAAGLANSAAQMFPAGTILYAMYASLGECSVAGVSLCTSQAILGIKPNDKLIRDYLYYFLVAQKPMVKALGQQGTQSNLNKGIVQGFKISLPEVAEQREIATILEEMDAELVALEQRRNKTAALKQGMMQELLTGRTRLV